MPRPRTSPPVEKPALVAAIESNLHANKLADKAAIKIGKILSDFPPNYQQDILGVVQEAINNPPKVPLTVPAADSGQF